MIRNAGAKAISVVHEWSAFAFVLAFLALAFLMSSLLAAVLFPLLPRRFGAPFGRGLIRHGFRLILAVMRATGLCRIDLTGLRPLLRARGVVVAANHPSLLDVVLIVACLPNAVCIMKAGLWNNILLGGTARLAGYLRNDAAQPLVRRAAAELRAGANMLIFPEGTRTPPGQEPLGTFRPGFALMARAAGAEIQVVLIECGGPYLCKGWPVWRKPPLPLRFAARCAGRDLPAGRGKSYVRALETRMRAALG